ncbi:hypothetical protein CRUP_016887, partial [Coryphaenoides rupestris]
MGDGMDGWVGGWGRSHGGGVIPGTPVAAEHSASMAGDSDAQLQDRAENNGGGGGDVAQQPFLIGVSGGTASGKSSVCEKIMELLGQDKIDHHQRQVAILSQDSFYRELTPEQKAKALKGQFNFDHP